MIKLLSWILVVCVFIYFLGVMGLAFVSPHLIPTLLIVVLVLGSLSGALLLLLLIRERMKDKEAEKNDLNKY